VLVDDLIKTAFAASCLDDFNSELPVTKEAFDQAIKQGGGNILSVALEIESLLYEALNFYQQIIEQLAKRRPHFAKQCEDIDAQLAQLIYAGFLQRMGFQRIKHLPRYLHAVLLRLDRLSGSAVKDLELCEKLSSLEKPLKTLLYNYPEAMFSDPAVVDFRWLLEELRVSLFAQQLKTPKPVSLQRVTKEWTTINHNQYPKLG
jgi:ATP-dependent helicase HrpA